MKVSLNQNNIQQMINGSKLKIAFTTLGCRLNQFETDALISEFDRKGFDIVNFKDQADITVINTCTVTSQSDHKSRNIIQQAISANPGSYIVVTGCMAVQYQQQLEKIPGVSLVVSNKQKSGISDYIQQQFNKENVQPIAENLFAYRPVLKSKHTRAAIKIQDGCDNLCTFCIIPQVRGRAVSRPVNEVLQNVQETLQNGFKEIVITGVNIGRYYHNGVRFTQLLKQILDLPGDFRVRISSLEPDGFDADFIKLFHHPKLTPHLHLCLQSGSNAILLKMRRMYSTENFTDFTTKLKVEIPAINLTTDVIVGFPDETNFNFIETKDMVRSVGFSHVHTFKYSERSRTLAARMKNQVSSQIKNERSEQIRILSEEQKKMYYNQFIGKTQKVLVEKHLGNNLYFGYGQNYIPVVFHSNNFMQNEFVDIKIRNIITKDRLMLTGDLILLPKLMVESRVHDIE